MKPMVILTEPTAVGKTELSIRLAKILDAEIISADSMQVYKKMDIGTAKIMPEEMEGIKHYLVDELDPKEEFHVARFQQMAKDALKEIYAKGKIPLIVGGTGFYIQSLLYDIDFEKGLDIMAQSRISLNVMSWHKGGMTERIANAMLNYSVCVTDETSYINRHFVAGENIVTFNLDNIDKLPDKIRTVLQDENLQKYIEKNAYKKALSEHTWDNRSDYFMNILGEIEK